MIWRKRVQRLFQNAFMGAMYCNAIKLQWCLFASFYFLSSHAYCWWFFFLCLCLSLCPSLSCSLACYILEFASVIIMFSVIVGPNVVAVSVSMTFWIFARNMHRIQLRICGRTLRILCIVSRFVMLSVAQNCSGHIQNVCFFSLFLSLFVFPI